MKICIYGLPCSGKTTLCEKLESLGVKYIRGSKELEVYVGSVKEKREKFVKCINDLDSGNYVVDGHYEFPDEVAYVYDVEAYDAILYLWCNVKTILNRMVDSEKNRKYMMNFDKLSEWQENEIKCLREECHKNNKDFYVLDGDDFNLKIEFIFEVLNGRYSCYKEAERISQIIKRDNDWGETIMLFDADKTIVSYDTSRRFLGYKTNIFDNNYYTGYQFWLQSKEIILDKDFICPIKRSDIEFEFKYGDYIISSGPVWNYFKLNIPIFSNNKISADTKYFLVKLLKGRNNYGEYGFKVDAYGDSKNDIFMLNAADNGYLVTHGKRSKSLKYDDVKDLNIYDKDIKILTDDCDEVISQAIEKTKSSSDVNGPKLAKLHEILGEKLGFYFDRNEYKPTDTVIVCMLRSGLFLANGLYQKIGCPMILFDDKRMKKDDLLDMFNDKIPRNVLIVDAVINSGKTTENMIRILEDIEVENIIIVAGVIQINSVSKFASYKCVYSRISDNSFVGSKVSIQSGNKGPDTADRLFGTYQLY